MIPNSLRLAVLSWTVLCPPAMLMAASGDELLDNTRLQEVRLYLLPEEWARLRTEYMSNTYFAADMEWRGGAATDVAIRSRGNGSRSALKPGLRVDFNRLVPGRRVAGRKAIILDNLLQDASFVREALSMTLFRRMGIPTPKQSFARLFVNDAYLGLYAVSEEIDTDFVARETGLRDGHLYEFKWIRPYHFEYLGPDSEPYLELFEPRNKETTLQRPELPAFMAAIHETPDAAFTGTMSRLLRLDEFLTHLAVEHYIGEWDGLAGTEGVNNFYLYADLASGQFRFLPWDKDVAFVRTDFSMFEACGANTLVRRLFQDPAVVARFLVRLAETAEAAGDQGGLLDLELQRLESLIAPAALEDPNALGGREGYLGGREGNRQFVLVRRNQVLLDIARLSK